MLIKYVLVVSVLSTGSGSNSPVNLGIFDDYNSCYQRGVAWSDEQGVNATQNCIPFADWTGEVKEEKSPLTKEEIRGYMSGHINRHH